MTPKQVETIKTKIKRIKNALAADKKRWGGVHDDSCGLRYAPPRLFLQLQDYTGALKYFKWFEKNFPDDSGYPIFLFEWAITLFKTDNIKDAEIKALQTFISNTHLFDKFLDKPFLQLEKLENSNWENVSLTNGMKYSIKQADLHDFANWLSQFLTSDRFYKIANEFVEIEKQLLTEPVGQKRSDLVLRQSRLLNNY